MTADPLEVQTGLSASQRRTRASIASNVRWSKGGGKEQSQKARAGLRAKFEREVDPDGNLSPEERAARADRLERAHYQRMQLASSKARARNAARRSGVTA